METQPPVKSLLSHVEYPANSPHFDAAANAITKLHEETPERLLKFIQLFATIEDKGVADSIPKWHAKAVRSLTRILFPTLESKSISASSREGRFFGHLTAMFCELKTSKEFRSRLSPKTIAAIANLGDCLQPILNMWLIEVTAKPRQEVTDFFEGVAHAMPRTFDQTGWFYGWTDASLLYFIIGLAPDLVGQLERVSDLHEFLCNASSRNWDIERTKKFCTRIGLSFRQKGRPRKNKGTT